ncbi:hypothetical protein [Haloplanus natans]|uniref:hypothetical protein n=1 Tax=Haloplanus natans TaxID=376171 RepID=UPI0006783411|nr:hypothetical protein [Haloplanus natans]
MSAAGSVSHHASLRWLQRVDAREPRPGECVLAALDRAEAVDRPGVIGDAYLDRVTDTLLVVAPDGCVRTVWPGDSEGGLPGGESP